MRICFAHQLACNANSLGSFKPCFVLSHPHVIPKVSALKPLAEQMGASLAQFSLAWCLQNPYVSTVMTGASRVEQVHENMKAINFTDSFTPDVMNEIDRIFGIT